MAYLTLPGTLGGRGAPCLHVTDERAVSDCSLPGSYSSHLVDPGSEHAQTEPTNSVLACYVVVLRLEKEEPAQCLPDLVSW